MWDALVFLLPLPDSQGGIALSTLFQEGVENSRFMDKLCENGGVAG